MSINITTGIVAELSPMILTDSSLNLFTNITANIQADKEALACLSEDITTEINSVIHLVETIKSGSQLDLVWFQDKIDAILQFEGVSGDNGVIQALSKIYHELNRREQTDTFRVIVESDATVVDGKIFVDLTSFGFSSEDDYSCIVKIPTIDGKNYKASFKKLSETSGEVEVRNLDYFQSEDIPESYYRPAVDGRLEVLIQVVYVGRPLHTTLVSNDELGTLLK